MALHTKYVILLPSIEYTLTKLFNIKMKRILSLLFVFANLIAQAQISWPPKSFPCNVPFILPAEIEYYWGINKIICTGRSGNGYKFKVTGTGNHDHSAAQINMLYMQPSSTGGLPSGSMAGTYFFPAVEKGKPFYFSFEAAWKGTTPSKFLLFFMSEWISIPKEEPATTSVPERQEPLTIPSFGTESSSTRQTEPSVKKEPVFKAPSYPGGRQKLQEFLKNNMQKPHIAIESAGYGTTTVEFTITPSGTISNPNYTRRCNERVDKEVMRLVNIMPSWKPATKDGTPCTATVQLSMSIFPSFNASYKITRIK
jgi:hypothetical protein